MPAASAAVVELCATTVRLAGQRERSPAGLELCTRLGVRHAGHSLAASARAACFERSLARLPSLATLTDALGDDRCTAGEGRRLRAAPLLRGCAHSERQAAPALCLRVRPPPHGDLVRHREARRQVLCQRVWTCCHAAFGIRGHVVACARRNGRARGSTLTSCAYLRSSASIFRASAACFADAATHCKRATSVGGARMTREGARGSRQERRLSTCASVFRACGEVGGARDAYACR